MAPRNDTLNLYEKILKVSDGKIKPVLSASQLQKLQDLRKEQNRVKQNPLTK
jgi:hypothetical protein